MQAGGRQIIFTTSVEVARTKWEEYMHRFSFMTLAACAALLFGSVAQAQQPPQPPPPYGEPVTLEQAKKIAAAAEAEAKKIDVSDNIAVVDPRGQVVFFQRMDGNQDLGNVAIDKAVTAARLRRPTTASDADKLGGLPILIGDKIIGGIGISGGRGPQDAQVAEAGLAAIK
jgi:glc operon protein GlcG